VIQGNGARVKPRWSFDIPRLAPDAFGHCKGYFVRIAPSGAVIRRLSPKRVLAMEKFLFFGRIACRQMKGLLMGLGEQRRKGSGESGDK
jgi:hypothetical protein